LFEAVGLNRSLIDEYFTGTSSRIGGVGLAEIAQEAVFRHKTAFEQHPSGVLELDFGGEYHFRHNGEQHLWNPTTIARLQHAVKYADSQAYDDYARAVNQPATGGYTLRGLFEFVEGIPMGPQTHSFAFGESPIPIDQVEPASEIVKRFCTAAMSHGSISKEAHECLAVAICS
jgi:glutamate synthase domain-containing protein 2